VTEVGDQALLRSSGQSTSQSTTASTEAKDFKVVVTLDSPPDDLRPAPPLQKSLPRIKDDVLAIPIQALTMRDPKQLKAATMPAPSLPLPAAPTQPSDQVQGVFVAQTNGKDRVHFVPVTTGITGPPT